MQGLGIALGNGAANPRFAPDCVVPDLHLPDCPVSARGVHA